MPIGLNVLLPIGYQKGHLHGSFVLFMPKALGRVQGKADRLLQGAFMPAPAEALSLGLVDELVPKESLMDTAHAHMVRMLALPDAGRVATKQHQRSEFSGAWKTHASDEAAGMFSLLELPGTMRGLEAIMQKLASKRESKL